MINAAMVMRLGAELAKRTALGEERLNVVRETAGWAVLSLPGAARDAAGPSTLLLHDFALAWHDNGFPRVQLSHKHAAALMATKTQPSTLPDARAPWNAFLVDIPGGLLSVKRGNKERNFVRASVRVGPDVPGSYRTVSLWDIDGPCGLVLSVAEVSHLGGVQPDESVFAEDTQVAELAARLVFGVCMEMTSPAYSGGVVGPRAPQRERRTGEPRAWTFQLTRDVKVDCRDAVRAYARGQTRASPTVQTLVRGHWKQQPCGKYGAERKHIFVEPYWRGPEDAPIALRKHLIVTDDGHAAEGVDLDA